MRAQGFSAKVGFLDGFWVCTKLETGPRGALEALRLLQDVLEFLGLEAAWEKCEGPVQDVIFLGRGMPFSGQRGSGLSSQEVAAWKDFQAVRGVNMRLVVEWIPSKQNQFADALSRNEMRLFFELHKDWKAESLWRKDKDDWKLFARVFENLDRRFGPFSVDTCSELYKFIVARPSVFIPVERFEAETDLFSAPDYQEMRELEDGVAYFGLDAVARDTRSSHDTGAKKQACFPQSGIMLRGGVKFIGKDQMEVAAGFSKTNQFAEGEHKVLFNAVRYPAFCAVTLTGGALASNKLPRGPKAPVLSYLDEYQEMTQEQRSAIPRLVADSMEAAVDACC
eukprot:gene34033-biopygen5305